MAARRSRDRDACNGMRSRLTVRRQGLSCPTQCSYQAVHTKLKLLTQGKSPKATRLLQLADLYHTLSNPKSSSTIRLQQLEPSIKANRGLDAINLSPLSYREMTPVIRKTEMRVRQSTGILDTFSRKLPEVSCRC